MEPTTDNGEKKIPVVKIINVWSRTGRAIPHQHF
jgi:hypothetical protein